MSEGWKEPSCAVVASILSILSYLYFLAVFIWLCAWLLLTTEMQDMMKPYASFFPLGSFASGEDLKFSPLESVGFNCLLTLIFAAPHSIFARQTMKKALGEASRGGISFYRPLYVLYTNLSLHLVMYMWQDIPGAVFWKIDTDDTLYSILVGLNIFGILFVLTSTFAIDHFDLFGIVQGTGMDIYKMLGISSNGEFTNRLHYQLCRHPIIFGFMVMFWSTPNMTISRFLFAFLWTSYSVFAVRMEENDLRQVYPEKYAQYEKTTPQYCPLFALCKCPEVETKED